MISYMNFVATSLAHDSTSSSLAHFVTYAIMYHSTILWPGLGKSPKNSIALISNVRLGLIDTKGISLYLRGLPILWHLSHFWSWDL